MSNLRAASDITIEHGAHPVNKPTIEVLPVSVLAAHDGSEFNDGDYVGSWTFYRREAVVDFVVYDVNHNFVSNHEMSVASIYAAGYTPEVK